LDPPVRAAELRIDPRAAASVLFIGVVALVIAGIIAAALRFFAPDLPGRDSYIELFDLDRELNVPNWYSSGLLLVAASILALIASATSRLGRPHRSHWAALALIFLFLSADEAASIHNHLGKFRSGEQGEIGTGLAAIPWVWPAIVLVGLFTLAFIPFLRSLPRRTAALLVTAGVVYVGGALGLEIVGAILFPDEALADTFRGSVLLAVEELIEMSGALIFIYALLEYAAGHLPENAVSISASEART
jgi:hypothetical protein